MLYKRNKIWWTKFQVNKEEIRRSTGATNRREAEEFERRLKIEVKREHKAGRVSRAHTYGEALLRWINEGAPTSMWSHARNTRPYLDDVELDKVVPAALAMKSDMLKRGLSVMTINRRLAVVRRILNIAYKDWDWLKMPLASKIKLLSERGTERSIFLSRQEADNLLTEITSNEALKVISIAVFTGLRRGEILNLKPENWKQPYIVLSNKTKSGKPRAVPVPEALWPYVMPPFQITGHELRVALEGARQAIGRPEIRMHDLRHTYASWLAENPDIPLTLIRDLLGHSNLGVTSKYTHLRAGSHALINAALKKPDAVVGDETVH